MPAPRPRRPRIERYPETSAKNGATNRLRICLIAYGDLHVSKLPTVRQLRRRAGAP
jgi:hypothetical protein